jgi:hypothetical protein
MTDLTLDGAIGTLAPLCAAVNQPLNDPAEATRWRWSTRRQLSELRDFLAAESATLDNTWLAAAQGRALRERNSLVGRIGILGRRVLQDSPLEEVRHDLRRLLDDIRHHLQRMHDLAYDDIELELGGSE